MGKLPSEDIPEMNKDLAEYLTYYHTKRAHLSLNMQTPNAILKQYSQTIQPNGGYLTEHTGFGVVLKYLRLSLIV